jgi:hypothetical protein
MSRRPGPRLAPKLRLDNIHEDSAMGNNNSPKDDRSTPATSGERKIRGGALEGSDQKSAPDHADFEKKRSPDTEVRLDGEEDSLYNDGLDVEEDTDDTLAGTRGTSSGIKP